MEKVKDEEALDGYYLIVSSEMEESDDRIIDMYRGLWRIEESFKVTKSELARPVFVSTREHIEAHFLTCFIALMLSRILEMKAEHRYSIRRLLNAMVQSNCTYLKENLYLFNYHDEVLELIGGKTGIEFNHRILSLKEIKKFRRYKKISYYTITLCKSKRPLKPVDTGLEGVFEHMFYKT